jgi:ParB family chromosome partitioning protein
MKAKKGLGRGLDALLSGSSGLNGQDEQRTLPVAHLRPGKYQPRTHMDQASLQELADSIKAQGLVQPILVRRIGSTYDVDEYEIIAGERRWRASQLAGLTEIPTLIRNIPDEQALAMALIENIQREDLNPLEEAQGLQRLISEFQLTHQQVADAIGRSRSGATNLLRLLQLTPPVQTLLMNGDIDMGHARALLALDGAIQVQLAQEIAQKALSVREAERLVQVALKPPKAPTDTNSKPDQDVLNLQESLSNTLGAVVQIRTNRKGAGRLSIDFASLDQLDAILNRIQ